MEYIGRYAKGSLCHTHQRYRRRAPGRSGQSANLGFETRGRM